MDKTNIRRSLLWSAGLLLLCAAFSRTAGVIYSIVATDIVYAETVLPSILSLLKQIFDAALIGVGVASLYAMRLNGTRRASRNALCIIIAAQLIDALSAFLVDAITGSVPTAMLPLAALVNLVNWLASAAGAILAFLMIARCCKKKNTAAQTRTLAVLATLLIPFIAFLVNVIQFLIEVEFAPYAEEIRQILLELWQLIFLDGAVVWCVAWIATPLLSRIGEDA